MKKFFFNLSHLTLLSLTVALTSLSATAAGPSRIDVEEPTVIYCVSASTSAHGVFTIPISGSADDAVKISGTSNIQYDFYNSGGTFTNAETVYGTWNQYRYYACKATAAGNGNGPWTEDFFAYRTPSFSDYPATIVCTDMAYDANEEKIYGWFKAGAYSTNWHLGVYSGETAATVSVTQIGSDTSTKITAMAIDAEGTLWGIVGGSGEVYTIDKTNGTLTKKGSLSLYFDGNNQSAAIDPKTGLLYWGARNSYSGFLYEVNLTSMSATKLYDFPSGKLYNAFYIPAPARSKAAPAEVENLKAVFAGTGTDVKVTFTAPTKTFGGSDLTGTLTYNILIDGEAPATDATGTIEAGAAFDKTYTMTKGEHTVAVIVSNSEGESPKAQTEVYAGFDTPLAVTNLQVSESDGTVTISWNATEGQRGGVLDTENITYTVTRNPDNVVVAEKTKELSVTQPVPDAFVAGYTYTVTVNEGEEAGPATTSAMVMLGNPYTVPYTQDFENGESLAALGFVSTSDDSRLTPWQLAEFDGKKCAVVEGRGMAYPHTYALYTPLTEYKAGIEYTMTFKLACSKAFNYEVKFDVFACKGQSKAEGDIISEQKNIVFTPVADDVNVFKTYDFTFVPEEDGVYSICIFDNGSYAYQAYNLAIDDIEITAKYPTPLPATDLTAQPAAEGSRNIDLSFVLPTEDIHGNALTTITKVDVYCGEEVIATIDNAEVLVPGNKVDYTVENAPRGYRAYKVVVYNGEYASAFSTSVTAFSGYLNNLKIVNLSYPENIAIDGKGVVEVEVMNDGMEAAVGYTVELIESLEEGGRSIQKLEGVQLASDETHTYTFDLEWSEFAPESVTYGVAVIYDGDQNLTDSATEDFTVTYEQKPEDGIAAIAAGGATLSAANGVITVKGNANVAVYSLDGHKLAAKKVNGGWSKKLVKGVYIVKIGNKSYKVAL